MNKKITLGILVLCSAFGAFASLVQVSVTGTADTTEMGYTQGESYTFNWIVNDGYTGSIISGSDGDRFLSDKNVWKSEAAGDPWLWASVFGDGLEGMYHQCMAPHDLIYISESGLWLMAQAEIYAEDPSMGLSINGVEAWTIGTAGLQIPSVDYSETSFVNPAVYLEKYAGSYLTGGVIHIDDQNSNAVEFTVSSVTIGVVPEPSTVLLFCIGGIGAWVLRRNRMKGEEV